MDKTEKYIKNKNIYIYMKIKMTITFSEEEKQIMKAKGIKQSDARNAVRYSQDFSEVLEEFLE